MNLAERLLDAVCQAARDGTVLPSDTVLAERFGVERRNLNRVLNAMVDDGTISKRGDVWSREIRINVGPDAGKWTAERPRNYSKVKRRPDNDIVKTRVFEAHNLTFKPDYRKIVSSPLNYTLGGVTTEWGEGVGDI